VGLVREAVDSGGGLVSFREEGARGISSRVWWLVCACCCVFDCDDEIEGSRDDDAQSYIRRNPAGG